MSFTSTACYLLGALLFADSAYSSYELNQLGQLAELGSDTTWTAFPLPVDLYVEAVVAAILFLIGAFSGVRSRAYQEVGALQPLSKEALHTLQASPLKQIEVSKATSEFEIKGFGMFDSLENRTNYVDWSQRRQKYTEWLRKKKE